MSLLETIKADLTQARKDKNAELVTILSTLYGEALAIGKNKANRESTDEEVVATVKKTLAGLSEIVMLRGANENVAYEILTLDKYVPKQLSMMDMGKIIYEQKLEGVKNIMTYFKINYPGQYDGKILSEIAKAPPTTTTVIC